MHDHLINPIAQEGGDKRLEVDIESLRESLWQYPNGRPKEEITEEQTDKPRWVATSTMLCDPLAKTGPTSFYPRLRRATTLGILRPAIESQIRKLQQQKVRMSKISNLREFVLTPVILETRMRVG